jgi:two-component system, NarL family, sensor histidine kinase UhpB
MIARELHDEFGQSVTAMRSLALSIAQRAAASDPTTEQSARAIADESSRLYDAMHGIIPRLAPLTLDAFGLVEASGELVERTRRSHPNVTLKAHFDLGHRGRAGGLEGHGPVTLTPETALTLYRTAQEGITNALQHGHATTLDLRMQRDTDGTVTVELDDDGQGLPSEGWRRQGHYGLRWLEERVQSLGGTMQLHARAPRGTALRVSVPADPPKVHP